MNRDPLGILDPQTFWQTVIHNTATPSLAFVLYAPALHSQVDMQTYELTLMLSSELIDDGIAGIVQEMIISQVAQNFPLSLPSPLHGTLILSRPRAMLDYQPWSDSYLLRVRYLIGLDKEA